MYARLLAFSNGDLQALYDRADGFYRRQLILTTKDKPLSRVDLSLIHIYFRLGQWPEGYGSYKTNGFSWNHWRRRLPDYC